MADTKLSDVKTLLLLGSASFSSLSISFRWPILFLSLRASSSILDIFRGAVGDPRGLYRVISPLDDGVIFLWYDPAT